MAGLVGIERPGSGLVGLVLKRADKRNALCLALLEELCAAVESLAAEEATRVLLLRGEGPVFSAGLDLREAAEESLVERSAAAVERALRLLRDTPLVTIAIVQGGAFAGGAGLMAACDIVIAAEDARIGFPEVRRGLLPALIGDLLRTRIREGDLRELFLTGETIAACRAREIGLVQRVVPASQLMEEALRVARSVLTGGPETVRATKRLLADLYSLGGEAPRRSMGEWHREARRSAEAREGLRAFLENRPPRWVQQEQS
jgi:methylglutaconyl-CoA hydratase